MDLILQQVVSRGQKAETSGVSAEMERFDAPKRSWEHRVAGLVGQNF